jgi:hypothetical protein
LVGEVEVVVVGREKKSVRREVKADLIEPVRRERVFGTASERGVDRAMSSAAESRERTV